MKRIIKLLKGSKCYYTLEGFDIFSYRLLISKHADDDMKLMSKAVKRYHFCLIKRCNDQLVLSFGF